MSSDYLETLNKEQRDAVLIKDGPILILAGAGAGKTRVITERIHHLIRSGVTPSSILAITFTNKAAREMRERVEKSLREDRNLNLPVEMSERPFVSTFHSLGVHILREQSSKVGIKRLFTVFDREDSKRAVREALEKAGFDAKTHEPGKVLSIISKEKGKGITASGYATREEKSYFSSAVEQIWFEYEKILKRDSALDFDDLLLKTRDLLRDNLETRNYYREVWQYILIDEYQDTNHVQYEISKMLVGEKKNICVVGDVDQNIYSWRGADIKNILDFENDYPETKIVILERNYRSTKVILAAANAIIEKNMLRKKKNLRTENDQGENLILFSGFNEEHEAAFVADKAQEFIRNGTRPREIAVLYRANFQSRILEDAFMNTSVPYQVLGTRFFERKEVKDIIAYLRASLNPESLADLKRIINVPARGLGKATIAKIFAGKEDALPNATRNKVGGFKKLLEEIEKVSKREKPSETIRFIIKKSGLEEEWRGSKRDEDAERLENAYEFASFAVRYDHLSPENGVVELLTEAALQSEQDEMKEERDAVRLLTVHASKGLEFDVVFVAGLEDGLFPHRKISVPGITPEEAEEERRLFYVAITRARKKVFLSYAQVRSIFGRKEVNIPSEFIFDIPEEYLEEEPADSVSVPRKPLLNIEF
ncbi:MAG: UvrD-helicase domain-containing protein [Patescibacteria group bacterium]